MNVLSCLHTCIGGFIVLTPGSSGFVKKALTVHTGIQTTSRSHSQNMMFIANIRVTTDKENNACASFTFSVIQCATVCHSKRNKIGTFVNIDSCVVKTVRCPGRAPRVTSDLK